MIDLYAWATWVKRNPGAVFDAREHAPTAIVSDLAELETLAELL